MARASLVDVSRWQGDTDASRIKAAGFVGMVARCTVGWAYLDEQYARNRSEANTFDLLFGAYHVLWPSNEDPVREAEWFLSKAGDAQFLVLDVELTHGLSKSAVQAQAKQWLDHVSDRTDRRIVVYTGSWFWNQAAGWENEYPLWETEYTISQPRGGIQRSQQPDEGGPSFIGWDDWVFWQWTSGGDPLGAESESMDYNVFNGVESELRAWLELDEEPPAEPAEPVSIAVSGPEGSFDLSVEEF